MEKINNGNLLEYSKKFLAQYIDKYSLDVRKLKGQFFTPKEVSLFMASMFKFNKSDFCILDPGAGTGTLTAAICSYLLNIKTKLNINIDLYENDPNLLPYLEKTLKLCEKNLISNGHNVNFNIINKDFILHNKESFFDENSLLTGFRNCKYDYVITNPPYFKLGRKTEHSKVMEKIIFGQPNIYFLFLAMSINMLKDSGEIVFITPRSFCSGLYFKKFREWFLEKVTIENIHIFESRKEVFESDNVLQENVIVKVKKIKESKNRRASISVSRNKDFGHSRKISVSLGDLIFKRNSEVFIRIPTSNKELKILKLIDSWPNTLHDLDFEISTGPVVPFRAKEYLIKENDNNKKSVPLIWMHNIKGFNVKWPVINKHKEYSIRICRETKSLLLSVKNYVFVKRFSSKEQKRRIYAAVFLQKEFPYSFIGVENHINYIHKPSGELLVAEAYGIAAILNTSIIDNYFRSLNGNTQVNATDIRSLPFPKIEKIIEIGKSLFNIKDSLNSHIIENIVYNILNIDI